MLDGITFELKIQTFELLGSGVAGEFIENDHTYNELQFALGLKFEAFSTRFELSLFLFKGSVSGSELNFDYWMFGFSLGFGGFTEKPGDLHYSPELDEMS